MAKESMWFDDEEESRSKKWWRRVKNLNKPLDSAYKADGLYRSKSVASKDDDLTFDHMEKLKRYSRASISSPFSFSHVAHINDNKTSFGLDEVFPATMTDNILKGLNEPEETKDDESIQDSRRPSTSSVMGYSSFVTTPVYSSTNTSTMSRSSSYTLGSVAPIVTAIPKSKSLNSIPAPRVSIDLKKIEQQTIENMCHRHKPKSSVNTHPRRTLSDTSTIEDEVLKTPEWSPVEQFATANTNVVKQEFTDWASPSSDFFTRQSWLYEEIPAEPKVNDAEDSDNDEFDFMKKLSEDLETQLSFKSGRLIRSSRLNLRKSSPKRLQLGELHGDLIEEEDEEEGEKRQEGGFDRRRRYQSLLLPERVQV